MDISVFRNDIAKLLSAGYNFYSISDVYNDKFIADSPKSVVLTFDDGLIDHLHVAHLLTDLGITRATFYIPTLQLTKSSILAVHKAHLIRSRFGGASLELLHRACTDIGLFIDSHVGYDAERALFAKSYSDQIDNDDTKEFKRLINYYGSIGMRDQILDKIMELGGLLSSSLDLYLTPNQIQEIHSLGFEIGSHGSSHTLLSRLSADQQFREITSSKLLLEQIIGSKLSSFCYPYGGKMSYNETTISILKQAGFKCAVSVENKEINTEGLIYAPYELPRYDCNMMHLLFEQLVRNQPDQESP
jgi:peptidoglycan/xylan/chitin deacetylase (PgdA/CDA1 family)